MMKLIIFKRFPWLIDPWEQVNKQNKSNKYFMTFSAIFSVLPIFAYFIFGVVYRNFFPKKYEIAYTRPLPLLRAPFKRNPHPVILFWFTIQNVFSFCFVTRFDLFFNKIITICILKFMKINNLWTNYKI